MPNPGPTGEPRSRRHRGRRGNAAIRLVLWAAVSLIALWTLAVVVPLFIGRWGAEPVEATFVEAQEERQTGPKPQVNYRLRYTFEYAGATHTYETLQQARNYRRPRPGSTLAIYVPSKNPNHAFQSYYFNLLCGPLFCLGLGWLPLGCMAAFEWARRLDVEDWARYLGKLKPEVAGIVAEQARLAKLRQQGARVVQATIQAVEREERSDREGWIVLAEAEGRIYVSELLPADLGPHLVGHTVDVLVDAEDPERYAMELEPVLQAAAEATGS